MNLGTAIAMIHDKLSDKDEIGSIDGHFEPGVPATRYEVEVWPARGDPVNGKEPKWVHFKLKPRDA